MNALWERISNDYLPLFQIIWPSLLAAGALALAGGVQGVFVVLRRETLLVLSIPQLVTLGAAIALRHGWPTLPLALAVVLVALLLMAWSKRRDASNLLLPALYIAGTSVTILLVANAAAHLNEVQNMFSGIDVAVGETQSIIVAGVLAVVCLACAVLWRRWLLVVQAPAAAELAGVRPAHWNALFLILLAATLVLSTHALGAVLVIALFFLPAATVLPWVTRIPAAMVLSTVVAMICIAIGFVLSVEMNWPMSHSIAGAGFAIFLVSHLLAQIL